jgi:hypothetical protein
MIFKVETLHLIQAAWHCSDITIDRLLGCKRISTEKEKNINSTWKYDYEWAG